MARLILAICPSNQDDNPVLGGGNEMGHIGSLATILALTAHNHPAITARLFVAQPQSLDSPPGSLAGLRAQQREVAAWLAATRQEGDLTVSLNLHSDSGSYRHCGYYYDGPQTVSQWLGAALTERIRHWFGGRVLNADYSDYVFARSVRDVACPLLLEMGAHTIAADVAAVRDYGGEIAADLVETLAGFFGLESAPPLNTGELRLYGAWSLARLDNGEDPRDLAAFGDHLAAVGADPSSPLSRYGVPV